MSRPDKLTPDNILEHIESTKTVNNNVGRERFLELYHDRSKTQQDMSYETGRDRTTISRWVSLIEIRLKGK